jgi:hypothetical protein
VRGGANGCDGGEPAICVKIPARIAVYDGLAIGPSLASSLDTCHAQGRQWARRVTTRA